MKHAAISDFIKLASGELDAARLSEVEVHLGQCQGCRAEQQQFMAAHEVLGEWTADASPRDVWAAVEKKLDQPVTIVRWRWRIVATWARVAAAIVLGVGLGHVIGRLSLPSSLTTNAPTAQVAELEAADGLMLHALESPASAGLFPAMMDMLKPDDGTEAKP